MSDFVSSRIERTSLPWKSDIRPHIRRFNLKNARPDGGARIAPRRRSRPPHGFESFRPNWVTFEGKITTPPSAAVYRFQSVVFFCACFARSTAIVATTFLTTSSTSTPRISRNRYFMRSRSMCPRPFGGPYKRKLSTVSTARRFLPRPTGRALEALSRPGEWRRSAGSYRPLENQNKRGRPRGSRSCLWVVEEGLLGWGWGRRLERRLDDLDGLPVAAEVLRDPGRELESDPQAAVLEEDVGVLELGHVERDPLALLREGPLRASDQARALQGVDAAVARRDRYAVLAAQVDRGLRLLEGGHENLGRILVRDES